jgi:hypothetical protein
MLRQLRLTAERTVTRAGNIQVLTAKPRLENGPRRHQACQNEVVADLSARLQRG